MKRVTRRAAECCLIVCFLLAVSVVRLGRATSQVHSVWLEAGTSSPRPDPTGNSQRVLSQRTGLWSVASRDVLTNSASSLQPVIATRDQVNSGAGSSGHRRLDSDQTVSYVNESAATDLATTSDWQQQSGASNETNNGQVQFDEDQKLARQPVNNSSEQDELISTEVYNNTNNNNINHPASQSSAVGFEDFVRVGANASPPLSTFQNHSSSPTTFGSGLTNRTSPNAERPSSFIYYLTDGDRWDQHHSPIEQLDNPPNQPLSHISLPQNRFAPSTSQSADDFVDRRWRPQQATPASISTTAGNSRRKLHNSGTQYDLRESPRLSGGEFELSQARRRTIEHLQPERELLQFVDQLAATNSQRAILRPSFQATTPLAKQLQTSHRRPALQKQHFMVRAPHRQHQSALDGPLLVRHPYRAGHYYVHPSAQVVRATSNMGGRLQHGSQQQHTRQQLWRQKSSPSSNRNSWLDPQAAQRSFLQNYVPSLGGYRPKLKAPAMLSNWISSTADRGSGSQRLENSFYSTSSDHLSGTFRPPTWNSANYQYNYEQPSGSHLYSLLQPAGSANTNQHHYHRPTLAPLRPHHQQQSGSGFIPVVAVSVSKTSPMPEAHSNQMSELGAEQPSAELDTAVDYQPPPKRRDRKPLQQAKVHFDDYGNYASGSSGNPATLVGEHQRIAYQQPVETTTVKSALFGYMPHEIERPLMGAMSLFSPLQQQLAADTNRANSLYQEQQQQQQSFALAQRQHPGEVVGVEEPPTPLGLQLQANSYVQNDIAHPFASGSVESAAEQRRPLFYLDGGNPNHQFAKHDLPIVQSHQGLMNALLADGSLRSPHLLAAASELNPLMPVMFATPHLQPSVGGQNQDETTESSGDLERNHQQKQQQHVEPLQGSSALNNKGNRKRSGDFFASAGQLLLSALPLLLAPTLGLMFASSPNAVARYQGQSSFGPEPSGLHPNAIPSSHLSGPNLGVVLNASPAPFLFTPSPPLSNRFNNSELVTKVSSTVSPSTPTVNAASTSHRPQQHRPTLGPLQTLASWTGSTPPPAPARNYSIILTTLAPPPFSSVSSQAANKSRTALQEGIGQNSSAASAFDHHATHTIVLVHPNEQQQRKDTSKSDNSSVKAKVHYDIGGYEGVDFDAQFPSLRKPAGGQKEATASQTVADQQEQADKNKRYHYAPVVDNEPPVEQQHRRVIKPQNNKTVTYDEEDADDGVKLFPISRWPAMHRRTVSLVTSSGNKTMPDSSDKYKLDLADADTPTGGQQKEAIDGGDSSSQSDWARRTQAQQVHRRRIRRDLNSTMSNNEIVSHANLTLKTGKKLVKVVKKVRSKKAKESTSHSNNTTSKDPMMGEPSSARARFEQVKREDPRSEPSAHIIATMVAQMNDPEEAADNDTDRVARLFRQDLIERELREQLLRKKIILDKLATSNMYSSSQESNRHASPGHQPRRRSQAELEEEDDLLNDKNLSLGGRGHLHSAPVEVISSKVKVGKEAKLKSRHRQHHDQDEEGETNLVLADDTRKALTKFGNLLIKDTLHIPHSGGGGGGEDDLSPSNSRTGNNSTRHIGRRKSSPTNQRQIEREEEALQGEDPSERGVATEQSFLRTTPYPPVLHESRSQQYRQEPNSTSHDLYNDNHYLNHSSTAGQHYRSSFGPMRDQVNLIPDQDHIGAGYRPPDDGSRFGPPEDRRSEYSAPMNLVASGYAQPDRYSRPEPYSNYSNSREPPSQGYGSYYSRPTGREWPPSRSHHDSRGYPYPPVPSNYQQPVHHPNGSSYPPSNHRPGDDYYDGRRDSFSPPHPSVEDQRYNNNNKYPADPRYPAASQEHESWPPRASSIHDQRDQHPGYSGYPLQPIDREPAYTSQPAPQQQAARSIAGDSSAVNEYLKRVQFSDSDRDKLMASYLTCDGLLNDSDHCLERLSCEFSDPQNIERANKLDRAVSSILLGHILINTYIPNAFKLRLKNASLFGYTNTGHCAKYICNKLAKSSTVNDSSV